MINVIKNPKPFTYQYPNWIKTEWGFATEKRAKKLSPELRRMLNF